MIKAARSDASPAPGAVETRGTLSDNGLHPAQDRLGVAPQVVSSRVGLLEGGGGIRASWGMLGGRP